MHQTSARRKAALAVWLAVVFAAAGPVWGRHAASWPEEPELIEEGEIEGGVPDEPTDAAVISDYGDGPMPHFDDYAPCDSCSGCGPCRACGPLARFWLRDEYVGWWMTGGRVPTLVATSPDGSLPATETLYGDATYNGEYRSGNWFQAGLWFGCSRNNGITGDYFFVGCQSSPFSAGSDGDPVLTRPFIDANTGDATEELIAFPDTVLGSVTVSNHNSLVGAGGAWRHNICSFSGCCGPCYRRGGELCSRVDFVAGFRYYRFNDNLGVAERLTPIDFQTEGQGGIQLAVADSFRTTNNFYGAELGFVWERYRGPWMFEAAGKVALGTTEQIVSIDGGTAVSVPGQPTSFSEGGILALSSNIGRHTHNSFSVVPQISARLGYRLTCRLTMLVGYTAIYWDQVARAGEQIDTTVNPNLIPPSTGDGLDRPSFNLRLSDLFLQGITIGGEYRF